MPESHPTTVAEATSTTRRTVLRSAGLVALAGAGASALAACSSDAETASPSTGTSAPQSAVESPSASGSASASSSPSASASSTTSASEAAPSVAGTSVAKSEVTVGGGVLLADKYVVTQPTGGEYKAFTAICTHQGCVVNGVQDKEIVCACHGSHFSITDGSVLSGPAQAPLASVKLTESGSDLVIPD